ncbi:MAG: PAS domain S-box protein, partial [Desulfomicrobium sp.]|nr:PAS domain S-box protein [Desulfomicrobium sp.]
MTKDSGSGLEEHLRDALMNAPVGFSMATPGGGIFFANPALARMFGYDTPEELLASASQTIASLHDGTGTAPANRELRLQRRDGSFIWVSGSTRIVRAPDGGTLHSQTFTTDITEAKRMEAALRAREESTSLLVGSLPGMAFRRRNDSDLSMDFVSEGCLGLTGYSWEELLHGSRLSFNDLILPEYR